MHLSPLKGKYTQGRGANGCESLSIKIILFHWTYSNNIYLKSVSISLVQTQQPKGDGLSDSLPSKPGGNACDLED